MISDLLRRKEERMQEIIIFIMVFLVLLVPPRIYAVDKITKKTQPLEKQPIENTSNTAENFSLEYPNSCVVSCSTSCDSETGESICNNLGQGTYLKYLVYESLKEGEEKLDRYCDKNPNTKCGEKITNSYRGVSCYRVKVNASKKKIKHKKEVRWLKKYVLKE
jgi:hypothetical protein